ncbi:hypothetical protein E2C01_004849 [Portunus trituberculatus]|uniref:Uncharacterized protein n=1 Tax=Portunus trituberculatus TaxID=210409 RepID=A0A5B7CTF4_PORTR|nr:hypothetical protein [Portunus trituberculatus]
MEAEAAAAEASAIKHENSMSTQPPTTEAILNTPSISSLEDDLGSLSSLPTFNMAPYARRPHRHDQFLSLEAVRDQESSDASHALHSLPPTMAKVKLSSSQFPRYKRQYKVESIYVNDLYTLTYDEGETLESIKSIVVNYNVFYPKIVLS